MFRRLVLASALVALSGCANTQLPVHTTNPASSTLQGDPSRPAQAAWQRTELYFALGRLEGGKEVISESRWREFLDKEVTPRFPDGFSVLNAYGQWRDHGAKEPERLDTRVIVILHADSAQAGKDIEAIRLAWKRITGDLSVLRLSQPAQVSF
jgi:hypothetical protein